jgi:1-aminocyclopropane-1-carboxylate deaminase/D-cysteine desulfhydrase-like pyridoxal-dependent ACC family enzyme
MTMTDDRPLLFDRFPSLKGEVEWLELGEYPTPVGELKGIAAAKDLSSLYIKRDDLSSPHYGGNKVRKLEFVLARAEALGHESVMTFGAAGSNHVLATVIHGRRLGLRTIAVMSPQPNAAYVRKNLLLDMANGATFVYADSMAKLPLAVSKGIAIAMRQDGRAPFLIPPGGTSARGCLGYIDGALELKRQVDDGLLPEPEFIFVTLGSSGTAAGLMLGVVAAGMKSLVVPVRVVDRYMCNSSVLALHVNNARRFLHERGADILSRPMAARDIALVDEFAGEYYARFTDECMEAVAMARDLDGIKLEGTYTGKTMAGALDFLEKHGLQNRRSLFWNTYSSAELYETVSDLDYRELPEPLHRYFEEPLQEEEMGCEIVY